MGSTYMYVSVLLDLGVYFSQFRKSYFSIQFSYETQEILPVLVYLKNLKACFGYMVLSCWIKIIISQLSAKY
jgi:hypothetical protein